MKDKRFNFRKPPEAKKQEKENRSVHKPSQVRQFYNQRFVAGQSVSKISHVTS